MDDQSYIPSTAWVGACAHVDKYGDKLQRHCAPTTIVWEEDAYLRHAYDVMVARRKAAPLKHLD